MPGLGTSQRPCAELIPCGPADPQYPPPRTVRTLAWIATSVAPLGGKLDASGISGPPSADTEPAGYHPCAKNVPFTWNGVPVRSMFAIPVWLEPPAVYWPKLESPPVFTSVRYSEGAH